MSISSQMLQSLKPFQCPSCNYCFTSRDTTRVHTVSRFPLILDCGHTLCESCLKQSAKAQKKAVCPVCQGTTELEGGDTVKLPPDVYVLGIHSANIKQVLPSIKLKLAYNRNAASEKMQGKGDAFVPCELCANKEASFRCQTCEENFCNTCFDIAHKNQAKKRKHIGVPVYAFSYNSIVQEGCPEHDNRAIEFYCEDDNELTCSLCVVTGNHKGHTVITLADKNKACAKDLKKAKEDASLISKRLRFTEQKLSQAIPCEKVDNSQWVKQLHNHFHSLHTALILRENVLISQLEAISSSNVSRLEKMRQEISDSYKDLEAILRDAEHALENSTLSVSVPAIVKKLESAKTLPCHLIPITNDEGSEKGISLEFEESVKDAIAKHGKIAADIKPKFCLRGSDELPADFIVEPLPADSVILDNESVVSETFSEDSLTSTCINVPNLFPAPCKFDPLASRLEKVFVYNICSPSVFWVVCSAKMRELQVMSEAINRWCKHKDTPIKIPKTLNQGDILLVQYSSDKKWYRGRVQQVLTAEQLRKHQNALLLNLDAEVKDGEDAQSELYANIFYIDFGNSEVISISRMRVIENRFLRHPGFAKQCCLSDVVPKDAQDWSSEAIKAFANFVQEKEVNMQIIEERNNILYVDLSQAAATDVINDVPVSVRDALVFLEYACFFRDDKPISSKRNRNLRHFLPPEDLRANVRVAVQVSHVESPSMFCVQLRSTSRHLNDLIVDMQRVYSDDTSILLAVYVPYIGMMCAAKFQKDKMWYRAEVTGLPGGAKVEVLFVDFGNKEVMHHRFLRKLVDRFTKMSIQSIPCTLADVTYPQGTTGWTEEGIKWFSDYVTRKALTLNSLGMLPGEKRTKVVLYDAQDDVEICVNALIVEQAFAVSTGASSQVLTKKRDRPRTPQASPKTASPKKQTPSASPLKNEVEETIAEETVPMLPPVEVFEPSLKPKDEPKDSVKVHVSHVESPGVFYIRIAEKEEENLKTLMRNLQDVYKGFEGAVKEVTEGSSFAAWRESDGNWYRVITLAVLSPDVIKVRFVDYGHIENVPIANLRTLLDKFQSDQAFAVRCHLSGIVPAGDSTKWPQIATQKFKDLVAPHDILLLIGESDIQSSSLPSDLLFEEIIRGGALEPSTMKYESVVDRLVECGVALRIRKKKTETVKSETGKLSGLSEAPAPSIPSPVPEPCCSVLSPKSTPQSTPEPPRNVVEKIRDVKPVERKPVFQWKAAELPSEMKFKALPTHVSDSGSIFIQIKPNATSKVDVIKKAMECKYVAIKPEKLYIVPPIGEAIAAKFVLDQKWYRAEIVSDTPDCIKVQFVDYGNYEMVHLDDIRLDIIMKDMPRQCLECELFDTKPASITWPRSILDLIHDTVVEQECSVEFAEMPGKDKKLQITLTVDQTEIEVSHLLKEIGEAVSDDEYEARLAQERKSEVSSSEEETDISEIENLGYKKARILQPDIPFPVCITQLIKPNIVCFQKVKLSAPILEEEVAQNLELDSFLSLMEELSLNAMNYQPVTNPKPGLACCAQYTYDNQWYRCEITETVETSADVLYVDYGNGEVLPVNRLRRPEEHIFQLPVQAYICRMKHSWRPEQNEVLLKMLFGSGKEVFAKILVPGDIPVIDLYIKNDNGELELVDITTQS